MTSEELKAWAEAGPSITVVSSELAAAVLALFAERDALKAELTAHGEARQIQIDLGVDEVSANLRAQAAEAKLAEAERERTAEKIEAKKLWLRVEALEKALRLAEWGYYRDDTYEGGKCPACGGLRRGKLTGAQYGHRDGCTTVAALARKEGP